LALIITERKYKDIKDVDYHIVETHKPIKTKDGYTLYTLRIVKGPKPPEKPQRHKRRR